MRVFFATPLSRYSLYDSVLNVEEGAEYTIRNGDNRAELNLNEYGTDGAGYAPEGRINREHHLIQY